MSIVARTDNKFEAIQRHGRIAIADSVCGPYNFVKPTNTYPSNQQPSSSCQGSIYPNRQTHTDPLAGQKGGPPQNIGSCNTYGCAEDPTIWYSGGMYHVLYDYPEPDKVGYHLYSSDGMKWSDGGFAYDPRLAPQIFGLVGSTTVNQWYKMERPAVALENGHVVAVTWAVSDVNKNIGGSGQELGPGTNHGSKVVMAAFDGASMDCDLNPAACTSADGGARRGQRVRGRWSGRCWRSVGGAARVAGQTGSGGASGGSGGASSRGGSSGSGGGAAAAGGSSASAGEASADIARAARYGGGLGNGGWRRVGPGPAPARAAPAPAEHRARQLVFCWLLLATSRVISGRACPVRSSCSGSFWRRGVADDRARLLTRIHGVENQALEASELAL